MEQRDFIKAFKKRGMTALKNEEPFEAYIYLWLAFLQSCAPDNVGRITSDRNDIIKPWNIRNFQRVNDLLRDTKLKSNLDWLSKRQEGCIINPEGRHEKDVNRFKLLSSKIRGSYCTSSKKLDINVWSNLQKNC
jgi:hypothetical protein